MLIQGVTTRGHQIMPTYHIFRTLLQYIGIIREIKHLKLSITWNGMLIFANFFKSSTIDKQSCKKYIKLLIIILKKDKNQFDRS